MATLYGNQYNGAFITNPISKVQGGDLNGHEKVLYFDYTITAAPTAADLIKLGKIPKGARITEALLSFPDLGTTGVLELGWAASADLDSAGAAVEAASASGLLSAVDVNAAAVGCINMNPKSGAAVAGFLKKFTAECDLQITVTTAWTVTSGTIKGVIKYIGA